MPAPTPTHPSTVPQQALAAVIEPAQPILRPQSVSVALTHVIHTTLHIQLTRLETSNMSFLTTIDPSSTSSSCALGSFVYAMPNRLQPTEPLCTALYSVSGTIDFATRVAKIITRRTGKPAYVGCSVVLPAADVEEEMGALKTAVEGIMAMLPKEDKV